jgi:hypothetical protein
MTEGFFSGVSLLTGINACEGGELVLRLEPCHLLPLLLR